ncbi:hypothetical protein KEM48_011921 [Puccinia striiformis f. sp. tritici PST-130]|nr:hypothetical protein KEM48_011921 [Puccinia striiformis f. sp. tritici PST-130]
MQSNNTSNYQSPPISRLKQINKQQGQSSTLNIHPKTKYQKQQQVSAEEGEEEDEQEVSGEHEQQTASQWSMTDRLRLWRDDARAQHLIKLLHSGDRKLQPNLKPKRCILASTSILSHRTVLSSRESLTSAKRINPKTLEPPTTEDISHTDDDDRHHHQDISQDFSFWDDLLPDHHDSSARIESSSSSSSSSVEPANTILVRMTDYSTACRYLAAQCMIRQGKWDAALEMVGEQNPFREHTQDPSTSNTDNLSTFNSFVTTDSSSFILLRLLLRVLLWMGDQIRIFALLSTRIDSFAHKALDRAKLSFLESLAIDVKCYESFEALVGGNMLEPEEGNNSMGIYQSLSYHTQTPEDKLFIKSLYTVRLKKFEHKQEIFDSIKYDDDQKLLPSLFLLSHELIERDSSSPISWYGAGLWYFSQRRWEESRRFFSKAALLDSRFPEAWFAFGHALAYEGEHDQAITAYSTASHNFQGWEESIKYFNQTIELVIKSQTDPVIWAPVYLNLSHCYRRLKRQLISNKYYHESLVVLPADPMTTCLLQFSLDLESLLSSTTTNTKNKSSDLGDLDQDASSVLYRISSLVPSGRIGILTSRPSIVT